MTHRDPDENMPYTELVARIGAGAISDARLAELRARMFPVLLVDNDGKLVGIDTAQLDPRRSAFGFSGAPRFDPGDLREIGRVDAYYTCAYYGFFKPTEAECLAQIPEAYLARVVAYGGWDMDEVAIVADGGGHRAPMRLYARD